ncbi:hypothetical protein TELCIR_12497 [Teladorsagia circumcincta]|uniref:Uncharacterized protein n=1 Tax=Teladorsagia circumcincta TaxID=45464 RepID=A0A2G9U6J9_TELCI|nr:hypothetical protein TELCIR_12497 [Teladorsagia circumcincta]
MKAHNLRKEFHRKHSTTSIYLVLRDAGITAQKRKSAFVRFGKRSIDEAGEVEKRKSAFVRFGRSAPFDMPEKRKSQYIRFGRK